VPQPPLLCRCASGRRLNPRRNPGAALRCLALLLLGAPCLARADAPAPPERLAVSAGAQALTVWSRGPEHAHGAVVLVHGLTWSARPAFDFEPRSGSRSLLRALAAAGLAAYALDLPGYGSSPRDPSGWLSPESAVADVEAVLGYVAHRHAQLPAPVLLGWSRGSRISALTATLGRQPLSALILYAYNQDPAMPPAHGPASGAAPLEPNTDAWARSDFVSPAVASPELVQDFAQAALGSDPVRAPVCCDAQFLGIKPESIHVPTLLIHGARDPGFKPAVASAFFGRLGATQRRWIVVGEGDHAAHLEATAPEVDAAIIDFIRAALTQYRK
jgi:pimeloyl-ACP methyl ester carboxylesterase